MDRKLIEYLPEYLREYKEEKALLSAIEPEFNQIWGVSRNMLKEAFVLTEGEYGAGRWESILALRPKDTDSLESRNLRILAKINEMPPYTMVTLRRFLDSVVGKDFYEIVCYEEEYVLTLSIDLEYVGKMPQVRQYVEEFTPANLILVFAGSQLIVYRVDICTSSRLRFTVDCYPRYNLSYLMYDGTACRDGRYRYNGYKADTLVDLYPMQLAVHTGYLAAPEMLPKLYVCDRAVQPVISRNAKISYRSDARAAPEKQSALQMAQAARVSLPAYRIHLTIGKHLTRYDGTHCYDGSRRHDSEIIEEAIE